MPNDDKKIKTTPIETEEQNRVLLTEAELTKDLTPSESLNQFSNEKIVSQSITSEKWPKHMMKKI